MAIKIDRYDKAPALSRLLKGRTEIAQYLGISDMTVTRWMDEFRGEQSVDLVLPVASYPQRRGNKFRLVTSTSLIDRWLLIWAQRDHEARKAHTHAKRQRRLTREAIAAQNEPPPTTPNQDNAASNEPSTK